MQGLQDAISQIPVLKDFLTYDDGGFHTAYSSSSAFMNFLQNNVDGKMFGDKQSVARYLNDFTYGDGAFQTLARQLFDGE
jgi:hypothetical protein